MVTKHLRIIYYKNKYYYATAPPETIIIENDKQYIMWLFYDELPPSLPSYFRKNYKVVAMRQPKAISERDLIVDD